MSCQKKKNPPDYRETRKCRGPNSKIGMLSNGTVIRHFLPGRRLKTNNGTPANLHTKKSKHGEAETAVSCICNGKLGTKRYSMTGY
jgi:hypothetical protein